MSWILAFAGFAALIILHEFGHFIAAKWTGMRVERFFLFFPPKLWSIKRGETEYGIGAIPLGGFVKITGHEPGRGGAATGPGGRRPGRRGCWRRLSRSTRSRARTRAGRENRFPRGCASAPTTTSPSGSGSS